MDVDSLQRFLHARIACGSEPDTLIVWEADHTYTAGRRTQPQDIPNDDVPVIAMDRGGSVTYHGPGQLVIYPIVKVTPPKDVVAFVRTTEQLLIKAVTSYGLTAKAVDGRSGVWINAADTPTHIESKLAQLASSSQQIQRCMAWLLTSLQILIASCAWSHAESPMQASRRSNNSASPQV